MRALCFVLVLASLFQDVEASDRGPIYVGFDGEYGLLNSTSAQSIELGIRLAIDEINTAGGVLAGRPLALVTRDNRSIPARGVANLKAFAEMKDLVAVFGGRFSPVLLQQIDAVHRLRVPLLSAWATATGITHHPHCPSYTFRLSLYDRIAMPFLIERARAAKGKRIGLMVPNTGWGRSNHEEARRYIEANRLPPFPTVWFYWGEENMLRYYQELRSKNVDTIILVANMNEGARLVRAIAELPPEERLPVVAHWGLTGGTMVENSGPGLFAVDLTVIQTFSFFTAEGPAAVRVLRSLREQYGIEGPAAVPSPVGLAHAYDLTQILARAIELAGTSDRTQVRNALEKVEGYRGLTGNYPRPFTPERHDALRPEQLFMARYRSDGAIVPVD